MYASILEKVAAMEALVPFLLEVTEQAIAKPTIETNHFIMQVYLSKTRYREVQ